MADRDIAAELEALFGVEEVGQISVGEFAATSRIVEFDDETRNTEFIPVLDLEADELFRLLAEVGVLRTPIGRECDISHYLGLDEGADFDTWGRWQTHQIELERDLSVKDRIVYQVSSIPLEQDDLGPVPVWVKKVWDGSNIPWFISYGTLIGAGAEVFRASIEIGEGGHMEESATVLMGVATEVTVIKREMADLRTDISKLQQAVDTQKMDFSKQLAVLKDTASQAGAGTELRQIRAEVIGLQANLVKFHKGMEGSLDESRTQAKLLHDMAGEQKELLLTTADNSLAVQKSVHGLDDKISDLQKVASIVHDISDQTRSEVTEMRGALEKLPNNAVNTTPDVVQIISGLEEKICSYADVTRASQGAALQSHDEELQARHSRSLNLRLSGLEEEDGEEVRTKVADFFKDTLKVANPEVVQAFRVGKTGQGKRRGRGFGGVAVWSRCGLSLDINVESVDPDKQFLCLRITAGDRIAFLGVAYFAPWGAPVYKNQDHNPFLNFSRVLHDLQLQGPVWCVGDFNSRIANTQTKELMADGAVPWSRGTEDEDWERLSVDLGTNQMMDWFIQFLSISGLTVLNGTSRFPNTKDYTYIGPQGSSVVDYLISSKRARDRVTAFELGPLVPESDHRPLICTLSGFSNLRRSKTRTDRVHGVWGGDRVSFEQMVERSLQQDTPDAVTLINLLTQSAKKSLTTVAVGRKPRYDEECLQARKTALEANLEDRAGAFRVYKQFIRTKRRRFVRLQQKILVEEIMKEPQTFWSRLRARQVNSDLPDAALRSYVTTLYCFADVVAMPPPTVAGTEEEKRARFQEYKRVIHNKRRRFLRERQIKLEWELMRKPQLFWTRLRGKPPEVNLSTADLMQYVKDLYFFPEARGMPIPEEPGCIFSESEVALELSRLGLEKAVDLHGWKQIETIHKLFLQRELGVRIQIPTVCSWRKLVVGPSKLKGSSLRYSMYVGSGLRQMIVSLSKLGRLLRVAGGKLTYRPGLV
ncbi:hypothetical protein R1sor_001314 [Riccia sorocarpa]|uniref:Endonuclease/exonuclease/phosphatase domain-containing protein n=1 Tax=Riccia sorocarpa TaxID=122646 RepID=A0ABD3GY21_9MARC